TRIALPGCRPTLPLTAWLRHADRPRLRSMSERPDLAGDSSLAGIIALLGFVLVATAQVTNMILARGLAGAVRLVQAAQFMRTRPKHSWNASTSGDFRDRIRALGSPLCNPRLRVRQGPELFFAILQVIVTAVR